MQLMKTMFVKKNNSYLFVKWLQLVAKCLIFLYVESSALAQQCHVFIIIIIKCARFKPRCPTILFYDIPKLVVNCTSHTHTYYWQGLILGSQIKFSTVVDLESFINPIHHSFTIFDSTWKVKACDIIGRDCGET